MADTRMFKSIPHLCLDIAIEHLEESEAISKSHRTERPDGGAVIRFDGQASMKAALVAIEFATAHIEAITWEAINRLHPKEATAFDRATIEMRLTRLGITDVTTHARCTTLRKLHKELYHNKPAPAILVAQTEATTAVDLARALNEQLSALVRNASALP